MITRLNKASARCPIGVTAQRFDRWAATLFVILLFALGNISLAKASGGDTVRLKALPKVNEPWPAEAVISDDAAARTIDGRAFIATPLSDSLFATMRGRSWHEGCPVGQGDLRHVRLLHRNAAGQTQLGELVVNKAIAEATIRIFRKLYEAGYRIERMVLIDRYGGDDERSMRANNTSAFCHRGVNGSQSVLSKHARGMAIDINPLYNPCVRQRRDGTTQIQPANARAYAHNRESRRDIPMKIDRRDLAYRLFTSEGFRWGGAWRSLKDYQHFEK